MPRWLLLYLKPHWATELAVLCWKQWESELTCARPNPLIQGEERDPGHCRPGYQRAGKMKGIECANGPTGKGRRARSTKKILYRIHDPTMRFWFRVYSPHRTLWRTYEARKKRKLIHDHAAAVFEEYCRARFPGARRYWQRNIKLDLVAPDPEDDERLIVAEFIMSRRVA